MNTRIKTLFAFIILTLVPAAWAESEPISIGYVESGMIEIDLEGSEAASVSLYDNGDLVFAFDNAGVTYAAPGVSWDWSGGYVVVSNLPSGSYTGTLSAGNGGTYSHDNSLNPSITWTGSSYLSWARATFIPY